MQGLNGCQGGTTPPLRAAIGVHPSLQDKISIIDHKSAGGLGAASVSLPRLAPGQGGVLLPDQARVHPLRLAAALARRAGTRATGVQVAGIEAVGSGASPVGTAFAGGPPDR